MKKIIYSLLITLFLLLPIGVLAEGYVSVSPGSLTIEQGSSKTITISTYNVIGDVTIKSNNSGVASVNLGFWETGMVDEKQSKSATVTVTGNSIGSTTITFTVDAATFDGDEFNGTVHIVNVNVVAKTEPTPTPEPTPSPTPKTDTRSKNNNIKELKVEGYELVKVDNKNYTLTVSNDVTSINVMATAEDEKATVTGTGLKELVVGENNIEVIVTSESGAQNKVNIVVTRKDGFYLENLDSLLEDKNIKEADIIINEENEISKDELTKIKESKKVVRFNHFDENNKLVYSWSVDGSKIDNVEGFSTTINYASDNMENIYKASNYADGIYINFEHDGSLPKGTKVKMYVGNKYSDGNVVNLYYFNKETNELELIHDGLALKDGYIEFSLEHCSDYFVTMAEMYGKVIENDGNNKYNILIIIIFVAVFIILGLVVFIIFKIRPMKKVEVEEDKGTNVLMDLENDINKDTNDFMLPHTETNVSDSEDDKIEEESSDENNI